MQRWIPVLAVMLGLQVALAAALGLRGDRLAAQKPDTPLVQADLKAADRLVIEGPSRDEASAGTASEKTVPVELRKQDAKWVLPSYYDAPADASKVQGVLDKLANIKRGYAVATTAGALKRFKVADDSFERRVVVSQGDETLATVYLGSSPGLRKAHARTAADEAVYAVELTAYELPSEGRGWLDTGLLKVDADQLSAIEVTSGGQRSLKLVHDTVGAKGKDEGEGGWRAEGLDDGERLDAKQAETLARAITELRVDGVLGTETKPEWRQGQPLLTLGLELRSGETVVWTLSKPEKGELHVLKASNRPWYLELEEWNAKPLMEAAVRDKLVVAEKPKEADEPEGGGASQPIPAESGGDAAGKKLPAASQPADAPLRGD